MSVRSAGDVQRYSYMAAGRVRRLVRTIGGVRPVGWLLARTAHHIDRPVFKVTKGRHTFVSLISGLPIVMLTTTGARTGRQGTVPVVGIADGERLAVIASNYGHRHHPTWYHNLIANPVATVEVGSERFKIRATPAQGKARDRLYTAHAALMPDLGFVEYPKRTKRVIPVLVLERLA